MCFSSHNIKPTEVNVNSVDCLIRGTTLQKRFGKQFEKPNKEPTALTRPPNFADPNPITIYGMRLSKPIQRRLHPEIHRTQRICCQSPGARYHRTPPWTLMFIPRRVKAFFPFFFSFTVAWGGGILLSLGFFLLRRRVFFVNNPFNFFQIKRHKKNPNQRIMLVSVEKIEVLPLQLHWIFPNFTLLHSWPANFK